jgi:NAD(P)-dependent dehydrogenase (short-subunit alcohol dehydrogenase family)
MAEFSGLAAVVTGGAGGIGAACAGELVSRGVLVAVLDRTRADMDGVPFLARHD